MELALAIINNLSGSSCIFSFFLCVLNCGWMVFNCDCMLVKSKNKANLYQIQNFTLFSQWESHQSLSENRGSQSESNENPIRADQKREDLLKPYRSLGGEFGFLVFYCKADPPKNQQIIRNKIGGGPPFTIVDVTLLRYIYPKYWGIIA